MSSVLFICVHPPRSLECTTAKPAFGRYVLPRDLSRNSSGVNDGSAAGRDKRCEEKRNTPFDANPKGIQSAYHKSHEDVLSADV